MNEFSNLSAESEMDHFATITPEEMPERELTPEDVDAMAKLS